MSPIPRLSAVAAACLLVLPLATCSRDRRGPGPTAPDPAPRPVWLAPAEGAVLVDSIRAEVRLDGPGVRIATLFEEERAVATRTKPPWTFTYLPPHGSSRRVRLRVAFDDGEAVRRSEERSVFGVPNRPPEIRWIPEDGAALYVREPGESLRVSAIDPEDGPLGPERVGWWSDRQGLVGKGSSVPALAFLPGRHRIAVEAFDGWSRRGVAEREVELLAPADLASPEGTVAAVRLALLVGRSGLYGECLDPSFRFRFCAADRPEAPDLPAVWFIEEERRFVERLHTDPAVRLREAAWSAGPPLDLPRGSERWAQLELAEIILSIDREAAAPLDVRGGRARLLLRLDAASGDWRIADWIDLGGGSGSTQGLIRWALRAGASSLASRGERKGQSLYR